MKLLNVKFFSMFVGLCKIWILLDNLYQCLREFVVLNFLRYFKLFFLSCLLNILLYNFHFKFMKKNVDYFIYNYLFYIYKLSSNHGSNRKIEPNRNIRFGWFEYIERFGLDCNFFKQML